jgi:hypothetical protein
MSGSKWHNCAMISNKKRGTGHCIVLPQVLIWKGYVLLLYKNNEMQSK